MVLTTVHIERKLKPRANAYRVADSSGLCIEIRPTGSKFWRYRYRYLGTFQMLTLGEYPAVSLAEARQKRDEAKLLLAQGKHPSREKKAERIRKQTENENTFEAVARRWLSLKQVNMNEKHAQASIVRMEKYVFSQIGACPSLKLQRPTLCVSSRKSANGGPSKLQNA